jgi:hypothetical protein
MSVPGRFCCKSRRFYSWGSRWGLLRRTLIIRSPTGRWWAFDRLCRARLWLCCRRQMRASFKPVASVNPANRSSSSRTTADCMFCAPDSATAVRLRGFVEKYRTLAERAKREVASPPLARPPSCVCSPLAISRKGSLLIKKGKSRFVDGLLQRLPDVPRDPTLSSASRRTVKPVTDLQFASSYSSPRCSCWK